MPIFIFCFGVHYVVKKLVIEPGLTLYLTTDALLLLLLHFIFRGSKNPVLSFPVLSGCKGHVMVGLWLSDYSYGKQDNFSGQ